MRTFLVVAIVVGIGCKHEDKRITPLAEMAQQCTHGDLGCPRAILYVHDLAASQAYYRDKLGFKLDWTDGDPADFASVSRGDAQLFMCQQCQGHAGSWMWVYTPDVDKLHAELAKRGAIIKAPPADKPWGVREMQVADPDGNVLRIGSPIERAER